MSKKIINPRIQKQNINEDRSSFRRAAVDLNTIPGMLEFTRALKEDGEEKQMSDQLKNFQRYYILTAYSQMHSLVSQQLNQIIKIMDSLKSFYLVDVIVTQFTEDALAPRISSDDLFSYSSKDESIKKILNDLKEELNLDQIIHNITPDLCLYGEYTLSTFIEENNGLVDLVDDVDQGKIISLYQNGDIEGYLAPNDLTGVVEKRDLADFVKFSLGGQRVKVQFDDSVKQKAAMNPDIERYLKTVPRYLRVGKSLLFSFVSKLRELELLEKLVPATKINKLSQGNIVALPVPEGYDLEKGLEAARRVEGMVNKKVMVDPTVGEITIESILSTAGKTRVIPTFGDKGRIDKLDYKSDDADDLFSNTIEIRNIILDAVGMPSELIFRSEGNNKSDILRRNAKYTRKLKTIQKALTEGLKTIAEIHLQNKGVTYDPKDIEVNFVNTLIEVDNLDKLEHADVTLSVLKNVKDFFIDMGAEDSPFKTSLNWNVINTWVESNLRTVGLSDALKTKEEGGPDINKEADAALTSDDEMEQDMFTSPEAEHQPEPEPTPEAEPTQQEKYPNIPFEVKMENKKRKAVRGKKL